MNKTPADKHCHFCVNQLESIDWKDTTTLQRFISHYSRIVPSRRTGLCAKHQRKAARTIKRAREIGLFSFVRK
jgi:small subunit ribosomal protein S18